MDVRWACRRVDWKVQTLGRRLDARWACERVDWKMLVVTKAYLENRLAPETENEKEFSLVRMMEIQTGSLLAAD